MSTLEAKISTILHRTLDAALAWVSRLLSQQKKSDFRPRDDEAGLALALETETPTCKSVTQFLDSVAQEASAALDGKNLSSFLAELALGLRSLVLEHLRRFYVSLAGGLVVSKDATKYVDMVRGWSVGGDDLEQGAMDVLVEVANLFVIGPEALRERLRACPAQEAAELRVYIGRREDAGSVGVQSVLNTS